VRIDDIILKCGSMSPVTASIVRRELFAVVECAYKEGFEDGAVAAALESDPCHEETWHNSVARRACVTRAEDLER